MVKRIIKINHITKQKIAEMCVVLLPRVGYARVTNSGLVILKESWYSLRSKRIPVTDVIIKYIPIEIGKLMHKGKDRDVYLYMFNDKVATVVSLTKYYVELDLLDYVYKEYARACMIPEPYDITLSYDDTKEIKLNSFNINSVFKVMKVKKHRPSVADNVNKLKSRIHVPNFLNKVQVSIV
jgi:hypothetical protein